MVEEPPFVGAAVDNRLLGAEVQRRALEVAEPHMELDIVLAEEDMMTLLMVSDSYSKTCHFTSINQISKSLENMNIA